MADFCHQCSIDHFGEDFGDLAGLTTEADTKAGMGAAVICEGCGYTIVDHEGRCIHHDCLLKHGDKP